MGKKELEEEKSVYHRGVSESLRTDNKHNDELTGYLFLEAILLLPILTNNTRLVGRASNACHKPVT